MLGKPNDIFDQLQKKYEFFSEEIDICLYKISFFPKEKRMYSEVILAFNI